MSEQSEPELDISASAQSVGPSEPRSKLNARAAIWLLILFILGQTAGQFLGGLVYGFVTALLGSVKGNLLHDPQGLSEFADRMTLPSIALGTLSGSLLVFVRARRLWPEELCTPEGAALRLGSWREILRGGGVGFSLACFYMLFAFLLVRWIQPGGTPFLVEMASRGGGVQSLFWLSLILLFAPFAEEPLFRGLMFAGFSRSFGMRTGGLITTLIFVLLHIFEILSFWPAGIGISLLALATLRFRIRTGALGPSIALHFAYNFLLLIVILASLLS